MGSDERSFIRSIFKPDGEGVSLFIMRTLLTDMLVCLQHKGGRFSLFRPRLF
jgi:hypothetical protein